jgi:glycosyltransferase involved in cell wall biosynthesis
VISVVMPAYNAERFLAAAVDSILAQTFREFELIVVDDGSTDGTRAILDRYAGQDARVRVVSNGRGGISGALNRGVSEARFDWIARMDGDDIAHPRRLERQWAAAQSDPRVVVWGAFAHHVNGAGRRLGLSRTGPTSVAEFQEWRRNGGEVTVIHPTAMIHRPTLLKAGGYDARFNGCEDFELWDRLSEYGPIVAIPEPLLEYRVHATSVSMSKFFTMRRLATFVIDRHKARLRGETLTLEEFERREKSAGLPVRIWWRVFHTSGFYYRKAGLAYGDGRYAGAAGNLVVAWVLNPRYTTQRAWAQFVAPKLRRTLKPSAPVDGPNGTASLA